VGADGIGLFTGVLLYRDRNGQWWKVLEELGASFSSVAISSDGRTAIYACEITGTVGWVDLRRPTLRYGWSPWRARSPEGVALLPGGGIVVAEESGGIWLLDPPREGRTLLARIPSTIESVCYDAQRQRLFVSDDGRGLVLSLPLQDQTRESANPLSEVDYGPGRTPVCVPAQAPGFLRETLARGGFPLAGASNEVPFRTFAERVRMVAAKAEALPAPGEACADALRRIEFLVMDANRVSLADNGASLPFGLFSAVYASGRKVTTTLQS
jgi:hypothetical protein